GHLEKARDYLERAIASLTSANYHWVEYSDSEQLCREAEMMMGSRRHDLTRATPIVAYRRLLVSDPNNAWGHLQLGIALAADGKHDDAVAAYREAIKLKPDYALAMNNLADGLANHPDPTHRDVPEAVRLAKKAVELDGTNGMYWNTLGEAQYRAGDWKGAVQALEYSLKFR